MFEKLKRIYNKDDFDYSSGQVDPYKFHPTFYFIAKAFQVLDNEPIPIWSTVSFVAMVIDAIIGVVFAGISTFHGMQIFDIPTTTEAGIYTIVLVYKLLILSCTQLDKAQYHCFLRIMREDFRYVCAEGAKYRERFFENQLQTWKVSLASVIFTSGIAIGMSGFALMSLIFYLITRTPGDGSKRPLLVPFWLGDVDFGATPTYEIAFNFSNYCFLAYAYNYIFMIQTQVVWVRQIATKADLVIWAIQDLLQDIHPATCKGEKAHFAELIKYRMREIVSQHQSMYTLMEAYAGVYKKLLMFEQKLCGPVVCLTAYCTAEKLDEGEFNAILLLLCIATVTLVFIPCYLCTFLGIKVKSISDACWSLSFWNAGREIRPYLVLIMQRSLRPLPLQAPGFEEISIQTFSAKMTSAYSLFNMLRQTKL
uniref:Odorant receptor n=1 Tax=Hedya nubiferana TaxID=572853 RepID=A0A223HD30_9NEOP|nr:putative odorant receptor OR63 [Hedya nubiferana]